MRVRGEIAAWGSMIFLLLVLVLMSTTGKAGMVVALCLAVGFTVVVALGPDRTGTLLLIAALGCAPMNALRPPGAGVINFSDVFFVLGFGLLLPTLIRNKPNLPPVYYLGSTLIVIGGLLASILEPLPILGVFGVIRFAAALVALPLFMSMLRPKPIVLTLLAAAYVGGQMISTAYAHIRPIEVQGRSFGWTRHPDFFGMGGHTAFALLIFLFYRLQPRHRWILIIPTAVVLDSVIESGSRASIICIALMAIAWPVVERTAVSWYVVISVGIVGLVAADPILSSAGEGSALSRIQGGASGALSDIARQQALSAGFKLFVHRPLTGNGFDATTLLYHNAYLEAAVGGGILALVGFVLVVGTLVAPLFRDRNRLAFVALSYAAFAMIGPSLWDRIVWAPLALIFVRELDESVPEPDPPPTPFALPREVVSQ